MRKIRNKFDSSVYIYFLGFDVFTYRSKESHSDLLKEYIENTFVCTAV
jgi:hypothetical protein